VNADRTGTIIAAGVATVKIAPVLDGRCAKNAWAGLPYCFDVVAGKGGRMTSPVRLFHIVVGKALAWLADGLLIVPTPLVEKNPAKVLAVRAPVVLSMARVIVLAFAAAVLHQVWHAGVAGWPESTLAIAIVLALPIVNALDRVSPSDVLTLAQALIGRFGEGAVRVTGSIYRVPPVDPSKYDDHRSDGVDAIPAPSSGGRAPASTGGAPSTEVAA
jgi:hypothetical protein